MFRRHHANPILFTHVRYLSFSMVVATLMCFWHAPVQAQNSCVCQPADTLLASLSICIGGTAYNVGVVGCTESGILERDCENSGQQNQKTSITQVCFIGNKPAVIDAQQVFGAILCELNPCKNPGIMGANVGLTIGDLYCWTIKTPMCVRVNQTTGCIDRCGIGGCCRIAFQWRRMASGDCELTNTWYCDDENVTCSIPPCTQVITCPTPTCCK